MVEQPNTAKIRADVLANWYDGTADATITALCDALDAARAERDVHKDRYRAAQIVYVAEHERAEAAEATLTRAENAWRGEVQRFKDDAAEQQRRAEAAEARVVELDLFVGIMRARIAAAVVVIGPDPATDTSREARIRSALDVEVTHKGWQITRAEAAEAKIVGWVTEVGKWEKRALAAEARVTELERLMEQEDHEWMRERDEVYRDHAADKARIAAVLARCKRGNRGGPYGLQDEITALLTEPLLP